MKSLIRLGIICAALFAFLPIKTALAASSSPVGSWTTISDKTGKPRGVMRITERGGVFYGTVVKSLDPQPTDAGICSKCPGRFKDKKINGLTIMWGLKKTGNNNWSGGKILDPETGKIYSVKMSLANNGRALKVRGFLGVSLLGRTQTWRRR